MSDIVREVLEAELLILVNLKLFGLASISWGQAFAPAFIGLGLWAIAEGTKRL